MTTTRRDLPQLLGDAGRWFERALLTMLEDSGETAVTPTEIRLFAVLDADGTTVAELARRMGVTRQTAHQAVRGLVAGGLLEPVPDPGSGRRRPVRRTAAGERVHARVRRALDQLEAELAARIGPGTVDALRTALESPWGPPPAPARDG